MSPRTAIPSEIASDARTNDDCDNELPEGWATVKLFDVCRPKQWTTISTKELTQTGFPVYGANGKIGYYSKYNHEHPTILITCRGATCGRINVSEPRSYVNGNAMSLDDLQENVMQLSFLSYALEQRGLNDTITGSAQPQITRQSLDAVSLRLAPLAEQRRIVAKLEGLLTKVSTTQQRLSRVPGLLKRFRQSVLAAACSGKLTADWREGIQTQRLQNQAFDQKSHHKHLGRQMNAFPVITDSASAIVGKNRLQIGPGTV
jgi:type I restriction enzyme S subunit